MIDNQINEKEFKSEFLKRFRNFCEKTPIFISFIAEDGGVRIFKTYSACEMEQIMEYKFDYTLSVKQNIHEIKKTLVQEHYPIIQHTTYKEVRPSAERLNKLVERGEISISEAPTYTETIGLSTPYLIDKVIMNRDELHLLNIEEEKREVYKMKKPVSIFLRKLTNGELERAGNYFFENATRVA